MSKRLKPCPFCGEVPKLCASILEGWYVECLNMDCLMQPTVIFVKLELLIKEWNTRND